MSHWDFSRRPKAEPDAPRPARPADSACQPGPLPGAAGARAAGDGWASSEGPTEETPHLAERTWPSEPLWPPRERQAAGEGWLPGAGTSPDDGWPSGDVWEDSWDNDEGDKTAPYPITYERDDVAAPPQLAPPQLAPPQPTLPQLAVPRPVPPPDASVAPWPPAPYPVSIEEPGAPLSRDAHSASVAGGQRRDLWHQGFAALGQQDTGRADPAWPGAGPGPGDFGEDPARRRGRHAARDGRRWLVLAALAVAAAAVGVGAVLLAGGSPGGQSSPAGGGASQQPAGTAPPVTPARRASASASVSLAPPTLTQAKAVLARYTAVNNSANARHSAALLATIETGSSHAIDAGLYRAQQGTAPFPAFAPAQATFYIPRDEPATGPRWFVAQVANAFSADPQRVTSEEYLLFTQQGPGAPWQDAAEPYLTGGASAPQIAVGADGLASSVSPDSEAVAVGPARLPAATAASIDGTGSTPGQPPVRVPGNLTDVSDERSWQGKLPGGHVTDAHTAAGGAAGQVFALRTEDGGALVFYTDAAQLTLTPPAGTLLHLTVPGFYSPGHGLSRAGMTYLEQFAAYDPPAGSGQAPGVVADYSGITGRD